MTKRHITSVRLDEYQRTALLRLGRDEDRSTSWLIQKAVDSFIEDRLQVSRLAFEHSARQRAGAQLLAEWSPAPWRVPTDEELNGGGEEAPVSG